MIRFAEEKDFLQLADMKWEHCQEDDEVYGEKNLEGVDRDDGMETELLQFIKHYLKEQGCEFIIVYPSDKWFFV